MFRSTGYARLRDFRKGLRNRQPLAGNFLCSCVPVSMTHPKKTENYTNQAPVNSPLATL